MTSLQSSSSSDDAETADDAPRRRRGRAAETISDVERRARENAYDYEQRFCGHCNTTTDIKEANFFGRYALALCCYAVT
jgi:WD and tetratricopeptide repeat-containing protein 1